VRQPSWVVRLRGPGLRTSSNATSRPWSPRRQALPATLSQTCARGRGTAYIPFVAPALILSRLVSDYVIPEPEPKEIDETLSMELRHLSENAVLKGRPSGEEKCENCRYYLEPTADISYCWHPKLRILVGSEWWCQWWDAIPEDS
jgi:hypothetical protein